MLRIGVWLSLVERYVRDVEAAGSNPVTPIDCRRQFGLRRFLLPKTPDSNDWTGVFFYILFFIAAYIKEDKGFPVHQNQFFYKQKIPYVHKSQWLGDSAH